MSKNNDEVLAVLKNYSVTDKDIANGKFITHTSYKGGKYHIPLTEYDNFLQIYLNEYIRDTDSKINKIRFLAERIVKGNLFNFYADIDFHESEYEKINDDFKEEYGNNFFENILFDKIVDCFEEEIPKYLPQFSNMTIESIVSTRTIYKIHINFPGILVGKSDAEKINDIVFKKLKDEYPSIFLTNKIFDKAVYNNGLRMLGSKNIKSDSKYMFYKIYDRNKKVTKSQITLQDLKDTTIRTEIPDTNTDLVMNFDSYKDILYSDIEDNSNKDINNKQYIIAYLEEFKTKTFQNKYFKKMEMEVNYTDIKEVYTQKDKFPCFIILLKDKICPFKKERHRRHNRSDYLYFFVSKFGCYLKCYDEECAKQHYPVTPIPLNECLKNIVYKEYYYSFKTDKEDITFEDHIILNDDIINAIQQAFSCSHFDISNLIYVLYKNRFRIDYPYSSKIKSSWYEFKNNRFHENSNRLNILLSTDVIQYLKLFQRDILECSANETISFLIDKLKDNKFKSTIINEASEIFYINDEEFKRKLDKNKYLIHFKNGVLDLRLMELRPGRVDDYITLSTHINYIPYEEYMEKDQKTIDDITDYFEKVFPIEVCRNYVLDKIACYLSGVREEEFLIFTGSGRNAKSLTCNLIQYTFGDYFCPINVSFFTKARGSSNSASPEVMDLKGRKVTIMQEPDNKEKFNMGVVKNYSGNDPVSARQLYKPVEKIILFCAYIMCCNVVPVIDDSTDGCWRRIRIIEFLSRFIPNPNPKRKYEFKDDPELKEKMTNWGEAFMSILIKRYKKLIENKFIINIPDEVTAFTNEFRQDMDVFSQYMTDRLEESYNTIPLEDIVIDFSTWLQDKNIILPKNAYTKTEIRRILNTSFGREKTSFNKKTKMSTKGFNIKFKQQVQSSEDSDSDDDI